MPARVIKVTNPREEKKAAAEAAEVLRRGGLVIFPTETVYGVAACVASADAMARLREIKARPPGGKPFTVHIGKREHYKRFVNSLAPEPQRLIQKGWPGPLTLVLPVHRPEKTRIARTIGQERLREIFHENTVGLRCPDEPVATRLLTAVKAPVVAASANRPGRQPPVTVDHALAELGDVVDLAIDTGRTRYAKPSTIVKFAPEGDWHLLRAGVLDERSVRRLTKTVILFVCSGNTCRSPIAEGLCRAMLASKLGCRPEKLPEKGFEVLSAGVHAIDGASPSDRAIEVCRACGVDISSHQTKRLTVELLRQADYIFTMCDHHTESILAMAPGLKAKVQRLHPEQNIEDPVGTDREGYVRCLELIRSALESRLRDIV